MNGAPGGPRTFRLPLPAREDRLPLLALLVLAALPYRRALLARGVLFERDVALLWYGQAESFVRAIAGGALPLWDPLTGFGLPMLANPNSQVLYPFTWLNLLLRPWTYYALLVVVHGAIAGAGLYLFLRRATLAPAAALTGAAVFVLSGPFLSLGNAWNHLVGAAYLPWALLGAERAAASGRMRDALAWAAALAAPVLAGSPETLLMALLASTAWAVATGTRGARAAALACGLALLLSCAQWLPTMDLVRRSARWGLAEAARTTWSVHPLRLAEAALPLRLVDFPLAPPLLASLLEGRAPWLSSIYVGIPALALAVAGLVAGERRRSWVFASLLALALLVALGPHTPVLGAATALAPPLRSLRFPEKAMILAALCVSVLAAQGVEAVRRGDRRSRVAALVVLGPGVATLVAGALAVWAGDVRARWSAFLVPPPDAGLEQVLAPALSRLLPAAGLAGLAVALALGARARPRAVAAGLALLAAVDLGWAHADLHPLAPRALFTARPVVLDLVRPGDSARAYVEDYATLTREDARRRPEHAAAFRLHRAPPGWPRLPALVLGVQAYLNPPTGGRWGVLGSYDPDVVDLQPLPLVRLRRALRETEDPEVFLKLLRLGGVETALALQPSVAWRALVRVAEVESAFSQPIQVFRVPGALGRAFVVGGARIASGDPVAEVLRPDFDPMREVVLESGQARAATAPSPGRARIVAASADRVRVEAVSARGGWLVLADAYDPGWRATVDGRAAQVLRANAAFRAVALPAGQHVVELVYRPPAVFAGLAVTGLALLAALARAVRKAA